MKANLKKRSVAILVMVVLIVLSILIGINRSFYTVRKELTDEYYRSAYGIQSQLDRRIEASNGLVGLAEGQVEEAVLTRLKEDVEALRNADSPSEQFDANSLLSGSFNAVASALNLPESNEFYQDFEEAQDAIQNSRYNQQAAEFNETRSSFPACVLSWVIFSGPLEEFR